jgi:hypothetical protein
MCCFSALFATDHRAPRRARCTPRRARAARRVYGVAAPGALAALPSSGAPAAHLRLRQEILTTTLRQWHGPARAARRPPGAANAPRRLSNTILAACARWAGQMRASGAPARAQRMQRTRDARAQQVAMRTSRSPQPPPRMLCYGARVWAQRGAEKPRPERAGPLRRFLSPFAHSTQATSAFAAGETLFEMRPASDLLSSALLLDRRAHQPVARLHVKTA